MRRNMDPGPMPLLALLAALACIFHALGPPAPVWSQTANSNNSKAGAAKAAKKEEAPPPQVRYGT